MSRGFSLVELLIVMAIIGILAAVAVPGAAGMLAAADAQRDRANAQLIAEAVNTHNSLHPAAKLLSRPDAWTDAAAAVGDLWPRGLSSAQSEAAYALLALKHGRAFVGDGL